MSNSDLYQSWLMRYAERKNQEAKLPPAPVAPVVQPDPNAGVVSPVPTGVITFKSAFLLKGQFGKDFLQEYNARVKRDYADASALKVLNWDDSGKVVTGSNPFAVILANQILNPMKIRTATQGELEAILNQGGIEFKNHYEESSLVWRTDADPNEYLAKNISGQLRRHNPKLKNNSAYVIPLNALSLKKDSNSPHKLAFVLNNPDLCFEAPILMSKNGSYIDSAKMNPQTGLPSQIYSTDPNGKNRQLWTINSGLSRLYLYGVLDVSSNYEDLAYSGSGGQVVCVSGEATVPKKFGVGAP